MLLCMLILKAQRVHRINRSHAMTLPRQWVDEYIKDIREPVPVIGLDCFVILPQKTLSVEEIDQMCDKLKTLIAMAQSGDTDEQV